jgi:GTPase SAR1 family protein
MNFPNPPPDRRTQKNENQSSIISNQEKFQKHLTKSSNEIDTSVNQKSTSYSNNNMALIKLKHLEDMRQKILTFKLLSEKTIYFTPKNSSDYYINKCNIILFGPSGSGKSSFIKSMYRALYNTSILPPDAINKLVIKNNFENEGTLYFNKLHLKEETKISSGIIICDTRGHIKMNDNEKEQFKILLNGNVKEGIKVEQRLERNYLNLWEFWKKDSELFPKEIFNAEEIGIDSYPHSIIFVFDGSSDEIIQKEDENFYKELIEISKKKGYENIHIHVILTRIDIFEKLIFERNKLLPYTERSSKVSNLKDEKIEKVIDVLGVNRSNIHFIENYHDDEEKENSYEIDYSLLKTMCDIINSCELYILNYIHKYETCFNSCFG